MKQAVLNHNSLFLFWILSLSLSGCGGDVADQATANDNFQQIKSALLNALNNCKENPEDADLSDVSDALPDESEDVPEEHAATIEKLRKATKELETAPASEVSAKIDELIALAETLPGEFTLEEDGPEKGDEEYEEEE